MAVLRVKKYIRSLKALDIGIDGYTQSGNSAFQGLWQSDTKPPKWHNDDIEIITLDFLLEAHNSVFLIHLNNLREAIAEAYDTVGEHQEELWVIAHTVMRQLETSYEARRMRTAK